MNPWGWVLIAIAIIAIVVGITGSQNKLYAFITGHVPGTPTAGQPTTTDPNAFTNSIASLSQGAASLISSGVATASAAASTAAAAAAKVTNAQGKARSGGGQIV